MAKQNDASSLGLPDLSQRNRVLVEFDANDPSPLTLLSFDPAQLGAHPMHTWSDRQGVTDFQRLSVVIRFGHRHAGSDGIATTKQGAEVGLEGDPEWCNDQVIRTRDRSSSSSSLLV